MSSPSPAYPPYQSHRNSQSFDPNLPPAPPPKPSSREVSRRSTPAGSQPLPPPPPPQSQEAFGTYGGGSNGPQLPQQARLLEGVYAQPTQDPGEQWLPKILEDKSSVTLPRLCQNMNLTGLQQTRSCRRSGETWPLSSTCSFEFDSPSLYRCITAAFTSCSEREYCSCISSE